MGGGNKKIVRCLRFSGGTDLDDRSLCGSANFCGFFSEKHVAMVRAPPMPCRAACADAAHITQCMWTGVRSAHSHLHGARRHEQGCPASSMPNSPLGLPAGSAFRRREKVHRGPQEDEDLRHRRGRLHRLAPLQAPQGGGPLHPHARQSKWSPAWPGCQRGPSGCLAEAGRSSGSTAFSRQRPPESRHAGRGLKPPLFPVTGAVDWKENEYSRVMESATALSVTPPPRPPGSLYTLGESAPAAQGLPWCCRPPVPTTLILRLSTPRYMPTDSFCDEFVNLDLRWPENCKKAVEGCDWCFNLAVRPPSQLHRTHPRLPRRSSPFGGHL